MPRVSRIRYVNLGHDNARMEDLILDLRDSGGVPTDTAIWLDNGGGKSSMLSLFFSLVRPALRDFLGARAEQKLRRLDDYIRADDHALIVGEWEMDETDGGLFGDKLHLVTGVYIERGQGSGEETKLDRTYFAFRVLPDHPRLALERLPVYEDGVERGTRRWTRTGFKVQMSQLRADFPLAQVFTTESQSEWTRHLDDRGIDTELFLYQVQMNQREGGAADLFKFRDVEDFVDFFVRVVLDENIGGELGETLARYRDSLKARRREFLPERKLVGGLADRYRQMLDVRTRRQEMLESIGRVAGGVTALRSHIMSAVQVKLETTLTARAEADAAVRRAAAIRTTLEDRTARVRVARHIYTQRVLKEAEAKDEEARREYDRVTRELNVVILAEPLSRAQRHRAQVRQLEDQLEMARTTHAPLWQRLQAAAAAYAAVLLARIQRIDAEELALGEQAQEASRIMEAQQAVGRTHERDAAAADARSRALAEEGQRADADLRRLTGLGAIQDGESPVPARDRWEAVISREQERLRSTGERLEELVEEARARSAQLTARRDEARQVIQDLQATRSAYAQSTEDRRSLENDDLVLEALRTERLDLDRADDATLRLVAQAAGREQTALFGLWSEEAEAKHVLLRLDEAGLLPASRSAEAVVAFLGSHLQMAVTGWQYASQVLSIPNGEARAFVERKPQLATGVVVRDDEFEAACALLASAGLELDVPVVVAPQRAAHGDSAVDGVVVGPSTDAHFDPAAGERERIQRQADLLRLRDTLVLQERRHRELQEKAFRLQSFRAQYPRGHFERAEQEIERLGARVESDAERIAAMEAGIEAVREETARLEEEQTRIRKGIGAAERAQDQVNNHIRTFGADPEERARERLQFEQRAREARLAAEEAFAAATEAGLVTQSRLREAGALAGKRGEFLQAKQTITEIDPAHLQARDGDLDAAREGYSRLRAQYTQEVNESGLEQERKREMEQASHQEGRFEAKLRKLLQDSKSAPVFEGSSPEQIRAEVECYIRGLPDLDRIEELRDELGSVQNSARGALSGTANALKRATEERDEAAANRNLLPGGGPLVELGRDGVPETLPELALWVDAEERSIEAGKEGADAQERGAERIRHEADLLEGEARRIEIQGGMLQAIAESNAALLARAPHPGIPAGWIAPDGEIALTSRINEIKGTLISLQEADRLLDREREAIHQGLARWISQEEFSGVVMANPMIRHLQARTPETSEGDAPALVTQLDLRTQSLDAALAEVEKSRSALIGQALAAAEKGIQSLEAAERQSRMPKDMPLFGGENFLKVEHKTPDSEQERLARMAALIDAVTDDDATPSGIEIAQKAVRSLGRPFRIKVMFPDKMRGAWHTEVERLGKDSGGEVLTSAILLFCNLARLRARNRGRLATQTSVLMLDNPFGTASRLSFLEVQLEVARAAGVQLVYTTGVKDYDAVSLFPNVNRLRPAGFDPKHRQFLLDRTDVIRHTEGVDMARMVRGARGADGPGTPPAGSPEVR